ncbi:MAG: hypothetical protein NTY00_02210 [Deltaproteobacteria bacterium]|nr:hypothetical protein [Deltaproteobacteria bacterium]
MQKTINLKTTLLLAGLLCFWLSSSAQATDRVVVIPMGGGTLKNVVTVAKANGKFTDPLAAVNSITDASATNPYLVLIAPGQYTLTTTLVMKPYVDITGSGENVTLLTGAISTTNPDATSAVVKGANHATLSNLSISNTGGNQYSLGIYTTGLGISARLQQVLATATGGTFNFGVLNVTNSSPIMTDMNVIAGGGGTANAGVVNNINSSPIMTEVNIVVLGGTIINYGVYNIASSSPIMTGLNTVVSGGTTNYGVYNDSSSPIIRRSSIAGATDGLANSSATATISQSTILNGVSGGGYTCVACDNGAGGALNAACL